MKLGLPLAIAALAASMAVWADTPTTTKVYAAGTPVMTVRAAAGGYTPAERADHIQNRLNYILGLAPIFPSDIEVVPSGQDVLVTVKNRLLFTADPDAAKANDSTPLDLANTWAVELKRILPTLTRPN
jgi:hypothetical protein